MNVFLYDNERNKVEINEPEILLVREFKALFDRDKTKAKTRAFREFTYIYLAIDWKSPYNQYDERERHEEALNDAEITEAEFNDPIFREACRKYKSLQEANKSYKLLKAIRSAADKLIDYFEVTVDFEMRKEDGTPIYKAKDFMDETGKIITVHTALKEAEQMIQKDLQEKSTLRAGATEDFDPGEF